MLQMESDDGFALEGYSTESPSILSVQSALATVLDEGTGQAMESPRHKATVYSDSSSRLFLSSSIGKKPVIITKDKEYFMEATFIVFQVERCLFRVPSYLFSKESHAFEGMFRLPRPYPHESDGEGEGSSEANPVVLPDECSKDDFRCLLKALYPLSFTLHLSLSKEEWISVLKLSTQFYFPNLRKTAISELENLEESTHALTSLEKITYGRKHRISSWLTSGLVDFVMRDAGISDDEALDIDSDYPTTAYKLFRTRELKFRGFLVTRTLATLEIEALFKDELEQVMSDEHVHSLVREVNTVSDESDLGGFSAAMNTKKSPAQNIIPSIPSSVSAQEDTLSMPDPENAAMMPPKTGSTLIISTAKRKKKRR